MRRPQIDLWGESFSPSKLKSIPNIALADSNEPGEIGKSGRYKGEPRPYGACRILVPDYIESNQVVWLANLIIKNKVAFKNAGATEIILHIIWFGKQGSMEFTIEELNRIAAAKVPLSIDYIFEE